MSDKSDKSIPSYPCLPGWLQPHLDDPPVPGFNKSKRQMGTDNNLESIKLFPINDPNLKDTWGRSTALVGNSNFSDSELPFQGNTKQTFNYTEVRSEHETTPFSLDPQFNSFSNKGIKGLDVFESLDHHLSQMENQLSLLLHSISAKANRIVTYNRDDHILFEELRGLQSQVGLTKWNISNIKQYSNIKHEGTSMAATDSDELYKSDIGMDERRAFYYPISDPESSRSRDHRALEEVDPQTWPPFNSTDNYNGEKNENPLHRRSRNNTELNYRVLLNEDAFYDWSIIADKILTDNEPQASIFLQQKLKITDFTQRQGIVDAVCSHGISLMLHRFGNFLVQRCFEYGTEKQIQQISSVIPRNVRQLSSDGFGCHVIQKALDFVSHDLFMTIVYEMMSDILETIRQRYANHVWQKLLENDWEAIPSSRMKEVNHQMRGKWMMAALEDTGSLIIQKVLQYSEYKDQAEILKEITSDDNLDVLMRNKWGSRVLQHILRNTCSDHEEYLSRIVSINIERALEYSEHPVASGVVNCYLRRENGGCAEKISMF